MSKISVLIVDDSKFMRSVIQDILEENHGIEVIGEAESGEMALEMVKKLNPDVITLDLEMPNGNGITVLSELRSHKSETRAVIVSSYTAENTEITFDCLQMGAVDFIQKPSASNSIDLAKFSYLLVYKVKAAGNAKNLIFEKDQFKKHQTPLLSTDNHCGVVVIGASTGGPVALESLLPKFSEDFPFPVIVAQHLPERFVSTLSNRIRDYSHLNIVLAKNKMEILPGNIYFIPGGHDGVLAKDEFGKVAFLLLENADEILTPSIDKLFLSAANTYKDKTIGVILTGMGKDGLLGAKEIKSENGMMIAQDKESSAVFGMPREVVEAGLADFTLPLDKIAQKIAELIGHHG